MRTRNGKSTGFLISALALAALAAFLWIFSAAKGREYRAEAAVTAVPTSTVHAINLVSAAAALSAPETHFPPGTQAPDAEERLTAGPTALTAAETPVQPNATPAPTAVYLASGSAGEGVRTLQQRLKDLGFLEGEADGQFGRATKAAVVLFQKQHGLDADGIVGEKTWRTLFGDSAHTVVVTPTPAAFHGVAESVPVLVNKQHPVGSDFEPEHLVYIADVIPPDVAVLADKKAQGVSEAVYALKTMLEAAIADGVGHWKIREAYRTYDAQKRIFNNYVSKYMEDGRSRSSAISATRLTVADPGTSEHHTGLAFDLNASNTSDAFVDTAQYVWLVKNCWEYGFVIRYTDEKEDVTGFLGEEWHYRYVGVEHARRMHEKGMCLEEYLEWLGAAE
ncbi:MAG: D-alanyl-D-alanine carboxypeptidase family protein [Clostridia bacterium]|nr:D-alanyl-D-alanine carboxypeptidase family protein [Clostridia bacterium]